MRQLYAYVANESMATLRRDGKKNAFLEGSELSPLMS